jgi:hypothetical protein
MEMNENKIYTFQVKQRLFGKKKRGNN